MATNKKLSSGAITVLLLFFSLFFLSPQTTLANKQAEALTNLYEAKLMNKDSAIDKSNFEVTDDQKTNSINNYGYWSKEKDKITKLPGQPAIGFDQYAGYVTVDESAGRAFFYYFVEAEYPKTSSAPLLLWLNGGPGCSSLAYGAMLELGPFRVLSDGKTLFKNKYSWNYAANVLFLESPAGVGFSYSNTTSDFTKGGDKKTAADNYAFLVNWLERFPEYKDRDFYISGESYAGHYVPELAHTILHHNKKAQRTIINLKGIIIGNAVTNEETDIWGIFDYFESHAIIPDELLLKLQKNCDFSPNVNRSKECIEAAIKAWRYALVLDVYNIYAPLCLNGNLTKYPKKPSIFNFDPCGEYYVYAYMNRPEVQEALHANVTKLSYDWEPCSGVIREWQDSPSTVLPLIKEFMENGLRVWIFSGDVDGRVPVTSSKYSINKMNLQLKTEWYPWFVDQEVGGYTEVYEGGLTFATVRGAGHQVPSYQPKRALTLINHFLTGIPLPNPN